MLSAGGAAPEIRGGIAVAQFVRILCPVHGKEESLSLPGYSDNFSGDVPCADKDWGVPLTIELKDGVVKSLVVKP